MTMQPAAPIPARQRSGLRHRAALAAVVLVVASVAPAATAVAQTDSADAEDRSLGVVGYFDSYGVGEGADDRNGEREYTDPADSRHISRLNGTSGGLALLSGSNPGLDADIAILGSSGAESQHLRDPQLEDPDDPDQGFRNHPMLELAPTEDVDVAVISLGGNDAGFAPIIGHAGEWDRTIEQMQAFVEEGGFDAVAAAPTAEELAELAGPEDELDVVATEQRLEEPDLEVPRERGVRADAQDASRGFAARTARVEQLVAEVEHRVRVVERDPSDLGQDALPPASFEELVADLPLELLDLHGDRRLRDVERLCRARQVALVSDGPEVAEVVEVQIGHSSVLSERTNKRFL